MLRSLFILLFLLITSNLHGQNPDKQAANTADVKLINVDTTASVYNPNRAAKAAFYSAVLPGLGQAYNKKYWKIPIVYGGFATTVGVYLWHDSQYRDLRDAYRIRLAGGTNDAFSNPDGTPIISTQGLERAQKTSQRNKELFLLLTAGWYILQIIDANVDGHLKNFNVSDDLSLVPVVIPGGSGFSSAHPGLSLSYTF